MSERDIIPERTTTDALQLHVALIGVGAWGQRILSTLDGMPRVKVSGLCDPGVDFEPGQRELSRSFGEILSDPKVSAVLIATPEATHAGLALKVLDADKWVFVEKPLCVTGEQARALEVHPRSKTHLMVGHLLQFDPAFRALTLLNRLCCAHKPGSNKMVEVPSGRARSIERITSTRLSLPGSRPGRCPWWTLAPHDVSVMNALWGHPQRVRVVRDGTGMIARVRYNAGVGELYLSTAADRRVRVFVAEASNWGCHIDDTDQRRVGFTGCYQAAGLRLPATPPLLRELSAFERGIRRGSLSPNVVQGLQVVKVLAAGQRSLESGTEEEV